jgi:proteasome lid subunit RPN8/RPN11
VTVVVMPREVRRAIVAHARREAPRECCGFLVGRAQVVVAAHPMRNVASGTTRFRIDDGAHIDLRRRLRQFEPPLEILGVYHSHPRGPAKPSPTDVLEAHYPDWCHIIVGLGGGRPRIAAFRIAAGKVWSIRLA